MSVTEFSARSTATQDWVRRGKAVQFPLFIVALIVLAAWLISLAAPNRSAVPFAPDNPDARGGRALAQVLGHHGVDIDYSRSLPEILRRTHADSTLLISDDPGLTQDQASMLVGTGANIVVTNPMPDLVAALAEASGVDIKQAASPVDGRESRAECDFQAAVAAGSISSLGTGFSGTGFSDAGSSGTGSSVPGAQVACFPATIGYHLVQVTANAGQTFTLVDDTAMFTNSAITQNGQAALALHLLGQRNHLVWYLPTYEPQVDFDDGGVDYPPLVYMVMVLGIAAVLAAILSFGRRLGPVVSEDLPVVVKSSETTLGRARLYRSSGARGRAAAALRAGSAARISKRLGVSTGASRTTFVETVSQATGREAVWVEELFFGPPPRDDRELTTLARTVQLLESEISV